MNQTLELGLALTPDKIAQSVLPAGGGQDISGPLAGGRSGVVIKRIADGKEARVLAKAGGSKTIVSYSSPWAE